jgi:hypothetical protein
VYKAGQPAQYVGSVLRSVAVQNLLRWLACFVHNRPPSPKFQILPSQLRRSAGRDASLSTYIGSLLSTNKQKEPVSLVQSRGMI